MSGERFVVVGLARVRAPWFAATSAWANSAAVPVEFVKCVSAPEVRARLAGGRSISALLVDSGAPGVERDLIDAAADAGAACIVVDDGRSPRSWIELGAAAVLDPHFDRDALLDCLTTHTSPIRSVVPPTAAAATNAESTVTEMRSAWSAPVVAVTGASGSGTSTIAMATAQALAGRPANRGAVVLADLCLRADQAMYHDPGDVVPGLSELVDAHRRGSPEPSQVREMCWQIDERGYDLLSGLRRCRDWASLRPRSVEAALDSLRSAYRAVVVDIDADFDGESETGSVDVEERNLLARHALDIADAIVVVGSPRLSGLHGVVRIRRDLDERGVDPDIVLTAFNRTRRTPLLRAELTTALADLAGDVRYSPPIFLPDRRSIESIHRSGGRLPVAVESPLGTAVTAILARDQGPVRSDDTRRAG